MKSIRLKDPLLVGSLQKAYSAERAAALAYVGHANSLKKREERAQIQDIEKDEWHHREEVSKLMREYSIPVSKWMEFQYLLIGHVIGFSCHLIGRFMPFFFAGKLESGNVCEYFVMIQRFHALGITDHDEVLYDMGVKEKEHEVFFQEMIEREVWLPWFEKLFGWGAKKTLNDLHLETLRPMEDADSYCVEFRAIKEGSHGRD